MKTEKVGKRVVILEQQGETEYNERLANREGTIVDDFTMYFDNTYVIQIDNGCQVALAPTAVKLL